MELKLLLNPGTHQENIPHMGPQHEQGQYKACIFACFLGLFQGEGIICDSHFAR